MSENTELLERLQQLLAWKKSRSFYADRLGISVEEVNQLMAELKGTKASIDEAETGNYIADLEDEIVKLASERVNEDGSREITYRSAKPLTREEIEKLYGVDGISTKLSTYWNKELPSGRYLTSALIKCIKNDFSVDRFQEFLSAYIPPAVIKFDYTYTGALPKEEVDVELSIADFHLDKLTVDPESIEERVAQYKEAVESLITKTQAAYNINTVAFILSNDFYHTDSYGGTTTKGTPLDVSTTWNEAYEIGFDLLVWAISYLSSIAKNVEVILVPGNHDRTKSFYLAHALEVYFKNIDNVWFDRKFDTIKYTVLGNTFIGYNHGDGKIDELPLIFATDRESGQEFGSAMYREVHTGDKHYYMVKEVKGVRIQQLPSLAGTDRWHKDMGYVNNLRAALALVYHPIQGKCAEFEHRI